MSEKSEFIRGKPQDASGEKLLSVVFKLIAFLIIVIGLQAAAQRFAWLTGYEPGWVGYPLYILEMFERQVPVYPFWLLFYWTLMSFRHTEIHETLFSAWQISIYTSIAAIAFYLTLEFFLIRNRKENVFGSARWARDKDLEKAGVLQLKGGVILGQTNNAKVFAAYDQRKDSVVLRLKKPARKIIQSGIYNTILSAPTRSGKGVSNVVPTLVSYPGSMIVLDFKGENFDFSSGFRSKFGKVYRWEPTGDKGHHFNPLWEIRQGEDFFADANLIADILTTPASGGGNATSDHFQTAAKDFLTALIMHVVACPDWKDKSLTGCRNFLSQIDEEDPENKKFIYDLMINGEHGDARAHQAIVEGAAAQRGRPDNEGGSVLSTVNNALAVFADPKIERNTKNSEFYIAEFEETAVPISLYMTIQYSDVARIAPLIRMFVTLFSRRFTGGETSANNRKFKVPILFILDEFDKLGRMDELEMNMGIHNGFGIHYFLIFQSLNQLNKIYTKDHSFLAHCRNVLVFAPGAGEYENAELISKICGRESFSQASISYSGGRGAMGYNNSSLSSQDRERNLINADEVMKLSLDKFILLCQGLPPYIGVKNVYYEDPIFLPRTRHPPAFTNREEAVKIAASTIKKIESRLWFKNISPAKRVETEIEVMDFEPGESEAEAMMKEYGYSDADEAETVLGSSEKPAGESLAETIEADNPF